MQLKLEHELGEVGISIDHSYSDCGMCELSYVFMKDWSELSTQNRMELYEHLLSTIATGKFQFKDEWGDSSNLYKAQAILSDAVGGACDDNRPCVYEMMTTVAPKLLKEGRLKYIESPAIQNPNSGNKIKVWVIQLNGAFSAGHIKANSIYEEQVA